MSRSTALPRRSPLVAVAGTLLTVVACAASPSAPASGTTVTAAGTGSTGSIGSTRSAGASATGSATGGSALAAELPAPTTTTPQVSTRRPATPGVLTGIRFGAHPGYDRAVLDVSGPLPAWRVEYVPTLIADGSGQVVPVPGSAILRVVLTGIDAHTAAGKPTVARAYDPGLVAIRSARSAGDFEAVVTYGLGTSGKRAFRVLALTSPNRVVVDVAQR